MANVTPVTVAAKSAPSSPKPTKVKRQSIVRLVDANGAMLRIVLRARKDGKSVTTYIVEIKRLEDGTKVSRKGATQEHSNMLDATKTVDSLLAQAQKLNWVRRESRNKPDAFTSANLPVGAKS